FRLRPVFFSHLTTLLQTTCFISAFAHRSTLFSPKTTSRLRWQSLLLDPTRSILSHYIHFETTFLTHYRSCLDSTRRLASHHRTAFQRRVTNTYKSSPTGSPSQANIASRISYIYTHTFDLREPSSIISSNTILRPNTLVHQSSSH
ncbi:hypothetical protein ACRALDRAFT_1075981, partial [Sodiomyces alcalophilus JCM 7366]|uniref:uncharacterized protein n=1 Tax=Sodiomyces alcalophilus JCM 7366 TaxID=591952 RepID=UPI0039B51710